MKKQTMIRISPTMAKCFGWTN